MNWKNERFENFRLYAVTDIRSESADWIQKAEAACVGGIDILQLRAKGLADAAVMRMGTKLRETALRHGVLFFVNDRTDLAVALQADGLHVGQDDLPVADARKILRQAGMSCWIGKSTHSLQQAVDAEQEGADYIGVGPLFTTPTKPDYRPVGLDLVTEVSRNVRVPFVAIGGINAGNIQQVIGAGARRIAVVRALWEDQHCDEAAKRLRECLEHPYEQSV